MHEVARLVVGPGTIVAEGADAGVDQRRIARAHGVVADAAFIQMVALPRVEHDVGALRELHEVFLVRIGIEVEHDAAFAEIIMPEMQAAIGVRIVVVERAVSAGLLATGRLDLDDVGAKAGEDLAAILAEFVRDLDHAQAVEKTSATPDCIFGQRRAPLL